MTGSASFLIGLCFQHLLCVARPVFHGEARHQSPESSTRRTFCTSVVTPLMAVEHV